MEMQRLDAELTAEIKKRTEMNKSTQAVSVENIRHTNLTYLLQWFETKLNSLNVKFRDILEEKTASTMEKLEVLDHRITDLGEHFEREKASILQQIDDRGRELTEMLNKFKVRYIYIYI
jgi:hypothetical protein